MRLDPAGFPLPKLSGRALKARHLLAVASGLAVLLSAGCSGLTSAGGAVSSKIIIGVVPGIDNAPLFLAERDGMFRAAGLSDVVIETEPNEAAELSALQRNQIDIAASDYGDIFAAQSLTPDLRILADGYDATTGVLEVLTLPGSSIKSPVDLANQRIGLPADEVLSVPTTADPVSLDAAAATEVLSNYLGNNATSVQWVPLSQQQEVTELQQHHLRAILVSEPYIFQAESSLGAVEVLDACSGSTAQLPLSGYVATNSWVAANGTAVADFQTGLAKAQSEASMTGQIQQVLPNFTGMTIEDADLATIGSYPTTTSANGLERVVRLMSGYNMIKVGPGYTWSGAINQMIVPDGS